MILNLKKIKGEKKSELENSKRMNKLFKDQLEHINVKITIRDNEKKKMNLIEIKMNNLKKKELIY